MTPDLWAGIAILAWIGIGIIGVYTRDPSDKPEPEPDIMKHYKPDVLDIFLLLCIAILSVLIQPILMALDLLTGTKEK